MSHLLSSPKPPEEYVTHIKRVKEQFSTIFPNFESILVRILHSDNIQDALYKMIIFHDLGKLTRKWQEKVVTNLQNPAHAPIGAAYLYKILPERLKEPISFAVAIHHSDKGLLGDNIERPDVQAISDGIIEYTDNKIKWDERVKELGDEYFPEEVEKLDLTDLKEMARGLRLWSRGCNLLEQHARRMQVSLVHHILKLCDISAASEREEYRKKPDDSFGGWLMVEKIKKYTDNLQIRLIAEKIKEKFNPKRIILFGSYAYGVPKKGSDLDLFVIMETNIPVRKQAFLIRRELKGTIPIDIIVRTPQQVEERIKLGDFFIKQVIQKGVAL